MSTPNLGLTYLVESQADKIITINSDLDILDTRLGSVSVTARTTALTLAATDGNKVFTNEGASGEVDFTLPSAAAGIGPYTFIIEAAQVLKVIAHSGDTIRMAATVGAAAGNISANTVGNVVTLVAMNATEWIVISAIGTWTVV